MALSKIEWTDFTFNPWMGCTKVSRGCKHCYAETQMAERYGKCVWGPQPKGTRVLTSANYWRQPYIWDREAKAAGERRRVFCASVADVFEDWQGPMTAGSPAEMKGQPFHRLPNGDWYLKGYKDPHPDAPLLTMDDVRARLWQVIDETPNLDWLLLTKRPENIVPWWLENSYGGENRSAPHNVWFGTSCEDQKSADERIPRLLEVPAAVRFLSCEPLVGPIDLALNRYEDSPPMNSRRGAHIHWVIAGGESGPEADPMQLAWAISIQEQCASGGVAFFMKQLGKRPLGNGHDGLEEWPITDGKGHNIEEFPEVLRVREFPQVAS